MHIIMYELDTSFSHVFILGSDPLIAILSNWKTPKSVKATVWIKPHAFQAKSSRFLSKDQSDCVLHGLCIPTPDSASGPETVTLVPGTSFRQQIVVRLSGPHGDLPRGGCQCQIHWVDSSTGWKTRLFWVFVLIRFFLFSFQTLMTVLSSSAIKSLSEWWRCNTRPKPTW
jgi:hypothetical protein